MPERAWKAYRAQRGNARARGVEWQFTPATWWAWWQSDNRWEQRGEGRARLVMARNGDEGPYSPTNIHPATPQENLAEMRQKKNGTWRNQIAARLAATAAG